MRVQITFITINLLQKYGIRFQSVQKADGRSRGVAQERNTADSY